MNVFDEMSKVLDEEKKCLLRADYQKLEKLSEYKDELTKIISSYSPESFGKNIVDLQRKSKRNDALLESAQRGIKSAMLHLKEASEVTFKSYSKEGARSPLSKSLTLRQKI